MNLETKNQLAARFGVEERDIDTLLELAAPRRRWPRFGGVVSVFALLGAGAVFAGVRGELVAFLSRVNPPEVGEVVPRQIPYRGYLEKDGVPVSTPQTFSIKLEYGDGGIAWSEPSLSLPVSSGHFEVALGDNPLNKIPPQVFADPFVLLSVSVGGSPLVGRQRLLTVPYAARALDSWRSSDATRASSATGVLATQVVPPGAVTAFVGTTAPAGWLLCDGAEVNRTTYANLFATVGTANGSGDGVTTFNLPDFRGRFLRGADLGAGRDPDAVTRVAANTGGVSGDDIGSLQGAAFEQHSHLVPINTPGNGGGAVFGSVSYNSPNTMWGASNGSAGYLQRSGTVGGTETRPVNVAVNYLIKY